MIRRRLTLLAMAALLAVPALGSATPAILDASVSPAGWNNTDRVDATWRLVPASPKLIGVRIDLNTANDGTADGPWETVRSAWVFPDNPNGTETAIPLVGREGRYAARLVAWDDTGEAVTYLGTLNLDRTAPKALHPTITERAPESAVYDWVQDTGGLAPSLPAATIEVQQATVFTPPGAWLPRAVSVVDGPNQVRVRGDGLPEGDHEVRLRSTDAAGNTSVTPLPWLRVDRTAPLVTDVRVIAAPTLAQPRVTLEYRVEEAGGLPDGTTARLVDGLSRTQVGQGVAGGFFTQTISADLTAARTYQLMIEVADAAGNLGRSAPVSVSVPSPDPIASGPALFGALSVQDPLIQELASAKLELSPAGATPRPNREPFKNVRYGETILIAGRLTGPDGAPKAGYEIEARDTARVSVGGSRTGPDGRFTVTVRPIRSGPIHVGVPAGDWLVPAVARPPVHAWLTPRLTLVASRTRTRAGGAPVAFNVTVAPSPAELGIDAKNVVLEWRDPFRGVWRPMINGTVSAGGRARFSWAFNAGGFTVPVRVRLPGERDWPTQPALSRAIRIKVT